MPYESNNVENFVICQAIYVTAYHVAAVHLVS